MELASRTSTAMDVMKSENSSSLLFFFLSSPLAFASASLSAKKPAVQSLDVMHTALLRGSSRATDTAQASSRANAKRPADHLNYMLLGGRCCLSTEHFAQRMQHSDHFDIHLGLMVNPALTANQHDAHMALCGKN